MSHTTALEEQARQHLLQPFTSIVEQQAAGPHVMVEGEGIRVRDKQGNQYIDAMAGLWCVNVGYGREEVVAAMAEQAAKLPYYHSFMALSNEPAIRLADRLSSLTPGSLNKVFFGNSGSDANDTLVKIVWQYNNLRGRPGKKKIVARRGGYHGVTVAAASMTGLDPLHKAFDLPLPGFLHVSRPNHYWDAPEGMSEREFSRHLAEELDETIQREGAETVAAFIAEPIMGAGGVIVPPEGYFEEIVPVLREHDVLLIADEVICGFGRLGRTFGSEYYELQPDLMTVAKGLTSGYIPMSASIIADDIFEVLKEGTPEVGQFNHGYTYSAHPVAAATALANFDLIEREGLVANAEGVGAYFQNRLDETFTDNELIGNKRGIGLIAALELVKDKERKIPFDLGLGLSKRLYRKLLEHGLICRPIMNSLCFSPPLTVTERDVDEIVDIFAKALAEFTDDIVNEGLWTRR